MQRSAFPLLLPIMKTEKTQSGLPNEAETFGIIGACFEVYNDKGCGFLEPVYHECLIVELELREIQYVSQPTIYLNYKGHVLEKTYEPDFVCFEKIVVEIKAVSQLTDEHRAQLINYLHATDKEVGLLINFGHYPKMEYERFANSRGKNPPEDD